MSTPPRALTPAAPQPASQNGSPSSLPPAQHSDRARFNRVGLINQGATCYLNSLLQVLYHLPYFRSSVYGVGDEASAKSKIPAALQELFFQLSECNHAPKTEALTKSFGWTEQEVMQQHDIHELLTLLRSELENRMKGTPSQGAINKLFEGKVENIIATLDGSYTSRRPEAFFDIQLEVAGHKTLMDSLRSLVKKDQLTGDNKYKVEEEGKPAVFKDAEKGLTYVRFPPVLCFHLKRFEMDMMSPNLDMRKINDRFEFPATLDLSELEMGESPESDKPKSPDASTSAPPTVPIKEGDSTDNANTAAEQTEQKPNQDATPTAAPLSPTDDFAANVPPIYDLHSIIVHRGNVHNGHYYCYIKEVGTSVEQPASVTAESKAASTSDNAADTPTNTPPYYISADGSVTSTGDKAAGIAGDATADSAGAASTSQITDSENKKPSDDLDFANGKWYEFDDEHVRNVTEHDAIALNFGGRVPSVYGGYGNVATNSAYMLTYIRRGFWKTIIRPTPTDAIPQRVKDEFRRVMAEEEARRRELAEEAKRCYISVVDDTHLFDYVRRASYDLYALTNRADSEYDSILGSTDQRATRAPKCHTIIMQKQDPFSALYDQLQTQCGYDKNNIRIRGWHYHFDGPRPTSYRPNTPLASFDECTGTLEQALQDVVDASATKDVKVAATNKAMKVLLYIEQKRIVPIPPQMSSVPTKGKDNYRDYTWNLLVTEPRLVEDAVASSHHDNTIHPKATILAMKAHTFMQRDPKPTLTVSLNRNRLIKAVVVRFYVAKHSQPINYMVYVDAYPTNEAFNDKKVMWRLSPQSQRLPLVTQNGTAHSHIFVLQGNAEKFPNIKTEPAKVLSVVVSPSSSAGGYIPNTSIQICAIYADEEGEARLENEKQKQEKEEATKNGSQKVDNTAAVTTSRGPPQLSPGPILPPIRSADHSLILMIKGFTPNPANGEHIRYLGPMLVDEREPLAAYSEPVLFLMGIPVDRCSAVDRQNLASSIRYFEERKTNEIVQLDPMLPMSLQSLLNGNIIIVEMAPQVVSSLYQYPTVMAHFNHFRNKMLVNVRFRGDPLEPLFQCQMDLRWTYHEVCEAIATRAGRYLTTGSPNGSPAKDKLNASLASSAASPTTNGHTTQPFIDADRVMLYPPVDVYTTNIPASDPIKCTSKDGQSLHKILAACGGRYIASDLFFDIHNLPRLQMEQRVQLRAVIAGEDGIPVTDEVLVSLPPNSTPPELLLQLFQAARDLPSVRANPDHEEALVKLARTSEAFCLIGIREHRVASFMDNLMLNFDDEEESEEDDDISSGSDTATPTEHRQRQARRAAFHAYPANSRPLDPSHFSGDIVYQLRPIASLQAGQYRMFVGFCDCPMMQYTSQAPLFGTPIILTLTETSTLNDAWDRLEEQFPTLLKNARLEPQKSDGLTIKLVMYTDQALSFNEWKSTPVSDYFYHTRNRSAYKPMLCVNKPKPKDTKGSKDVYSSAEPKLRLGDSATPAPKKE